MVVWVWVGGIPSDYIVSTQLQLWLFCCWGCGCCWAVTINSSSSQATGLSCSSYTFNVTVLVLDSNPTVNGAFLVVDLMDPYCSS